MKPFMSEQQFIEGETILQKLLPKLAELDPVSAVAGLSMCLAVAADAAEVPLPSVEQFMRNVRKGFQKMQQQLDDARAKGEAPAKDSNLIVVPG